MNKQEIHDLVTELNLPGVTISEYAEDDDAIYLYVFDEYIDFKDCTELDVVGVYELIYGVYTRSITQIKPEVARVHDRLLDAIAAARIELLSAQIATEEPVDSHRLEALNTRMNELFAPDNVAMYEGLLDVVQDLKKVSKLGDKIDKLLDGKD